MLRYPVDKHHYSSFQQAQKLWTDKQYKNDHMITRNLANDLFNCFLIQQPFSVQISDFTALCSNSKKCATAKVLKKRSHLAFFFFFTVFNLFFQKRKNSTSSSDITTAFKDDHTIRKWTTVVKRAAGKVNLSVGQYLPHNIEEGELERYCDMLKTQKRFVKLA